MAFSYYAKLSPARKRIYRRSDDIHSVVLTDCEALQPLIPRLAVLLEQEDRVLVERMCADLCQGITERLNVPSLHVKILAVRPSADWGELHGLYELDSGRTAKITLWMRTAKHKRVVAFRTFLRTLLHEICHHLDYHLYDLPDSFHTEGFYKRESSLFHQLVPD